MFCFACLLFVFNIVFYRPFLVFRFCGVWFSLHYDYKLYYNFCQTLFINIFIYLHLFLIKNHGCNNNRDVIWVCLLLRDPARAGRLSAAAGWYMYMSECIYICFPAGILYLYILVWSPPDISIYHCLYIFIYSRRR